MLLILLADAYTPIIISSNTVQQCRCPLARRCVFTHVSGAAVVQVEQEEEFLTNTLQKKLEKVTRHGNCQQLAQRAAIACFFLCCAWCRSHCKQCWSPGVAVGWQHPYQCGICSTIPQPCKATYGLLSLVTGLRCASHLTCCCAVHMYILCILQQLIKEKVDLESRLETEQEYVVNKLCKQVCICSIPST
jgi:hypothetical protein